MQIELVRVVRSPHWGNAYHKPGEKAEAVRIGRVKDSETPATLAKFENGELVYLCLGDYREIGE